MILPVKAYFLLQFVLSLLNLNLTLVREITLWLSLISPSICFSENFLTTLSITQNYPIRNPSDERRGTPAKDKN